MQEIIIKVQKCDKDDCDSWNYSIAQDGIKIVEHTGCEIKDRQEALIKALVWALKTQ